MQKQILIITPTNHTVGCPTEVAKALLRQTKSHEVNATKAVTVGKTLYVMVEGLSSSISRAVALIKDHFGIADCNIWEPEASATA